MKTLVIEWQRLLDEQERTCPRCSATEEEVEKAIAELGQMLASYGVAVRLVKKAVDAVNFRQDALQSNRIMIAGKSMEEWLGARTGQSRCCETCGDADCRTIEYEGEIHEAIPSPLIVRAGLAAVASLVNIHPPQTSPRIPVMKLKFKKR